MKKLLTLSLLLATIATTAFAQFNIAIDYSFDTSGFFTGANVGNQTYLNTAASSISSYLSTTSLSAITEHNGYTWDAVTFNPSGGADITLSGLSVAANTIVIYAGAQDLGGSTLGFGGGGGFSASGNQTWFDTISNRGTSQSMTWGGSITFNNTSSWNFDSNIATVESFSNNDFYSVAVHEILHVLGVGSNSAWTDLVSGGFFTGANAVAANGGPVSLSAGSDHWAEGTLSSIGGTSQEAAMTPSLLTGTRKYLTDLDLAGLQDMGFTVSPVPEPATIGIMLGAVCLVAAALRRPGKKSRTLTSV